MKLALKGALLSGLVFPGLGQMVLRHVGRGLAFVAVAAACTAYIVTTVVNEVMQSLPALESGDMAAMPASAGQTGLAGWILALCWLWGVVDAYRLGDRQDRKA